MVEVEDMTTEETHALLTRGNFGHLACARDNHPYVVPMHYAYHEQELFFFTTEGTKTEYMAANSEVCFQVEEIGDAAHWQSVMAIGHAARITGTEEAEHAMQLFADSNPSLTPALSKTEIGAWKRSNKIAIYRLRPDALYGRKTARRGSPNPS